MLIKSNKIENLDIITKLTQAKLVDFASAKGLYIHSNNPFVDNHCNYSATFTRSDLFYKLVTNNVLLTVIAPMFERLHVYSYCLNEDTSFKKYR